MRTAKHIRFKPSRAYCAPSLFSTSALSHRLWHGPQHPRHARQAQQAEEPQNRRLEQRLFSSHVDITFCLVRVQDCCLDSNRLAILPTVIKGMTPCVQKADHFALAGVTSSASCCRQWPNILVVSLFSNVAEGKETQRCLTRDVTTKPTQRSPGVHPHMSLPRKKSALPASSWAAFPRSMEMGPPGPMMSISNVMTKVSPTIKKTKMPQLDQDTES